MKFEIIILAGGKGSRMNSTKPKVLHELAGKPILSYVLNTTQQMNASQAHVVYGYGGDQVKQAFQKHAVSWVFQKQQIGTADAVAQAVVNVADDAQVIVLNGDGPLISVSSLESMLVIARQNKLALLTAVPDNPTGLGRILRDQAGNVRAIIEEKDATVTEREIGEVYTGVMAIPSGRLKDWLKRVNNHNRQAEYYLTDIVALALGDGVEVETIHAKDALEVAGINCQNELAALERKYQQRQIDVLLQGGLSMLDPTRVDIRGTLAFGQDCSLDINTLIEGDCELGNDVKIGAHCIIRDSKIDDGAIIEPYSLVEGAKVGPGCKVGPYARLRPGSVLQNNAKIGNFVEVKNSLIGQGSKANHLSYVGDAQIGDNVNLGAGLITCNYDGANKHKTIIGDNVFVGSDCQLVAPVEIGENATIGAGTTVYNDAPADTLTINTKQQTTVAGWKRPKKRNPKD